jgi:predicted amidohydrolase
MRPPDVVKVASAQYPIEAVASLGDWRNKISRWVAEGAATGAELLVFPEYASLEQASAFGTAISSDLQSTLQALAEQAGERVAFHLELARRHRVHILVGSGPVLRADGRFANAAQFVAPNGLVGEQTKVIMTPFERDWGVHGGGQLNVFDTALGRITVAICYDSEFPLHVRTAAQAGAELLLVPSCTEFLSGFHRIRTSARARALENQIACVTSPLIGEAHWSPAAEYNNGAAGVFVPSEHGVSDDGVLAEGGINTPGWVTASIDFSALRALRFGGEMRNFLDWTMQPGADEVTAQAEVINLKEA